MFGATESSRSRTRSSPSVVRSVLSWILIGDCVTLGRRALPHAARNRHGAPDTGAGPRYGPAPAKSSKVPGPAARPSNAATRRLPHHARSPHAPPASDAGVLEQPADRRTVPPQPASYRPGQFTRLPPVPHLDNLRFREPAHRNLPNEIPQLSPKVMPSPPETTAPMGGVRPWSSREAVLERLEESRSYAALLSVSLICFSRYRISLAVSP